MAEIRGPEGPPGAGIGAFGVFRLLTGNVPLSANSVTFSATLNTQLRNFLNNADAGSRLYAVLKSRTAGQRTVPFVWTGGILPTTAMTLYGGSAWLFFPIAGGLASFSVTDTRVWEEVEIWSETPGYKPPDKFRIFNGATAGSRQKEVSESIHEQKTLESLATGGAGDILYMDRSVEDILQAPAVFTYNIPDSAPSSYYTLWLAVPSEWNNLYMLGGGLQLGFKKIDLTHKIGGVNYQPWYWPARQPRGRSDFYIISRYV